MAEDSAGPINFLDSIEEIKSLLSGKELVLFLDYDGTLTPIVATPYLAIISDEMRATVLSLSECLTTAIVSGRATDDVRSKVQIDNIFYAGSHGFEIVQPDGKVVINEQAKEIRKDIDEIHQILSEQLKQFKGALVEHVKYTVSCHYRLVDEGLEADYKKVVEDCLSDFPRLRMTSGKKVFEIRPKIDWDKGKAVQWILDVLKFDPSKQIAVYIGDDTTDEDAFKALMGIGFGIRVVDEPRPTAAMYAVKSTEQVKTVLDTFLKLKS